MSEEETKALAKLLLEAIDAVLYAFDNKVVVDAIVISYMRNIQQASRELLSE